MRRLRKFWWLPARDRGLLLIALLLLGAIRLGLALLPFQTVRRLLSRLSRAPAGQMPEENAVRRVVWALDVASHILPGSTSCLPRALAGHLLLARRGVVATLQIGVARGAAGQLEAHAWI
jgi:hypothetical protein